MTNDIPDTTIFYYLSDNTTVHVYEGMQCMGIYDKETGVPEFVDLDEKMSVKDYSHKPNNNEARFRQITKEMLDLYSRKNTDYGGSFDESLDEDGLLVAKIRLKDKLNRFSQLINNDSLVEDESVHDTLIDLANYSIMTLMWLNEQENS